MILKGVAEIADTIGRKGEAKADIISLVGDVQRKDQLGHSLIMGKSFGGRLLSEAFMKDLTQMKSFKDWPLGSRSLLVTLNPAIGASAFDKVYENMPGLGSDVQRPVWLNLTSEDDFGTKKLFPWARGINQDLANGGKNTTIGHYMPYLSHWVTVGKDSKAALPDCPKEDRTKETKWFEIPERNQDNCKAKSYVGCVRRHVYTNESANGMVNRYNTTVLLPLCQSPKRSPGYIWNFQTDESVIADGDATNLISRTAGYHSADVQTILGRMLDDMLFTPPEK